MQLRKYIVTQLRKYIVTQLRNYIVMQSFLYQKNLLFEAFYQRGFQMSEKIRTNVVLDKELWRKTRQIALKNDVSASGIMNNLLKKFVDENGRGLK